MSIEVSAQTLGAAWMTVTMLAITASALTAYTVGSLRGARIGWELFAGLLTLSLVLPFGITILVARLPDLFVS